MQNMRQFFISITLSISALLLASCGGNEIPNTGTPDPVTPPAEPPTVTTPVVVPLPTCKLLNLKNDEILSYKLPIIYGQCPQGVAMVDIDVAGNTYSLPLINGYFKGVVTLDQGINEITLRTPDTASFTTVYYTPAQKAKKVQMVYAVAANDDGHFLAAPRQVNDLPSAIQRLKLQGLMMQSGTAEMLYKATGKRTTYAMIEDSQGYPLVKILYLSQSRAELHTKSGEELYDIISRELAFTQQDIYKNMVTMSFSDYRDGRNVGHTALGGGFMGLFGSFHLHACPGSIAEIIPSFSNATLIDTRILPDDSGGRGSYWANCATGMGASMHELGHTFDHLVHTDTGIMSRGFDNFNRLFVMEEPGYHDALVTPNEGGGVWDPISVNILLQNEWFKD